MTRFVTTGDPERRLNGLQLEQRDKEITDQGNLRVILVPVEANFGVGFDVLGPPLGA
jgi:hypothetical protein